MVSQGIIDQILEDDKEASKKQRHTAKRIFERLRDEHGYLGAISMTSNYIREKAWETKRSTCL